MAHGNTGRKRPDLSQRNRASATHGRSRSRDSTYYSWKSMLHRCRCATSPDYPRYGGRGIKVHPAWGSLLVFLADMGERPQGTSLGRIDNNGNYETGNCRWETPAQQGANKRPRKKKLNEAVIRRYIAAGANPADLAAFYGVSRHIVLNAAPGMGFGLGVASEVAYARREYRAATK